MKGQPALGHGGAHARGDASNLQSLRSHCSVAASVDLHASTRPARPTAVWMRARAGATGAAIKPSGGAVQATQLDEGPDR